MQFDLESFCLSMCNIIGLPKEVELQKLQAFGCEERTRQPTVRIRGRGRLLVLRHR